MLGKVFKDCAKARAIKANEGRNTPKFIEHDCPHCGAYDYDYRFSNLVSGIEIETCRGLGRHGAHCNKCNKVVYFQTDQEFIEGIIKYPHNHWIFETAEKIDERYLPYIPEEMLAKRKIFRYNVGIQALNAELDALERAIEQKEKRRQELQEMRDSGKLTELPLETE